MQDAVAMTRPKRSLTVIGDSETVKRQVPRASVYLRCRALRFVLFFFTALLICGPLPACMWLCMPWTPVGFRVAWRRHLRSHLFESGCSRRSSRGQRRERPGKKGDEEHR